MVASNSFVCASFARGSKSLEEDSVSMTSRSWVTVPSGLWKKAEATATEKPRHFAAESEASGSAGPANQDEPENFPMAEEATWIRCRRSVRRHKCTLRVLVFKFGHDSACSLHLHGS